ncbi:hypothetical protein VTL71DRAFT_11412 [Oculimacula yallundae]|uniref:Uncharacterized protein n=1 Tax=Oculimacula yallundae TaxID=86028 RepID=A0ABR4CQ47_9HELO
MPPLNWTHPVCAYTLFVVAIAVLSQITLKSRQRIRAMETEVQNCEDARKELKEEIEALREEMSRVREVDREEKLCLVETVKQVLQRSEGRLEGDVIDEAYSGSQTQDTVSVDENVDVDWVDESQIENLEIGMEDEISCPWCSHAHQLGLGDCSGDDTCDGTLHIPYCPSCFYKERKDDSTGRIEQETMDRHEELSSPAAVLEDIKAVEGAMDTPVLDGQI